MADYSDAKLQSFAILVPKVRAIFEEYAPKLRTAQDNADRAQYEQLVAERANAFEELFSSADGITFEEYDDIAQDAQNDPELRDRLDDLIPAQRQNEPPEAIDDDGKTSVGTAITVNVLANDSDPNRDELVIQQVGDQSNGVTEITGGGEIRYMPADGFAGMDTFTYTISDRNGGTDTAEVSVKVGSYDFFSLPPVDQVAAVYIGYFGRAPETAGREFWVSDLNEGVSQGESAAATAEEMAGDFRFSDEAQDIYTFLSPGVAEDASSAQVSNFVEDIFNNLFNRTPGSAGIEFWTGEIQERLNNEQNIGTVIIDVMAGAQEKDAQVLENKVEVANAFTNQGTTDVSQSVELIGSVDATEASVENALEEIG